MIYNLLSFRRKTYQFFFPEKVLQNSYQLIWMLSTNENANMFGKKVIIFLLVTD